MYIANTAVSKKKRFSFKPDFIAESVQAIDFIYLKGKGITTCFIDLDGTVVERGAYDMEQSLSESLKNSGMNIKIATNRPKSRTLKNLKNSLHATGVIHPRGLRGKPAKSYIANALNEYELEPKQVVMIGDRFVQDILGANRSGVYSLLVYKLGRSRGVFDKFISSLEKKYTQRIIKSYTLI